MNNNSKNPKGISFGKTLPQLFNGKTCTRRVWSDRTAKTFIRYYNEGVKIPALSKSFRNGGEIVGWLTLTQKPYQDELIKMTKADLEAEGFPDYTFDQFITEFFDGKNQTVWVIWFEFVSNEHQDNLINKKHQETGTKENCTHHWIIPWNRPRFFKSPSVRCDKCQEKRPLLVEDQDLIETAIAEIQASISESEGNHLRFLEKRLEKLQSFSNQVIPPPFKPGEHVFWQNPPGELIEAEVKQVFKRKVHLLIDNDSLLTDNMWGYAPRQKVISVKISELVAKQLDLEKNSNVSDEQATVSIEMVDNHDNQTVIETEELTDDEQRDRLHLERKVERAFYEAGKALQELRDRRLYRSTHETFENYCQERFGHSRQKANFLIAGAKVYDNLTTNGCQIQGDVPTSLTTIGIQTEIEMTTNGCQKQDDVSISLTTNSTQILPTSERQVRPLAKLEPEVQVEAWTQAVAEAGGKVPSGRIVKSIVDQFRERHPVPNPWRVGEVAQIIVKENPDLRGKGGCWAVITEVHQFSCTVRLWDGEYQVRPENLRELNYSKAQQDEVKRLCDRLAQIQVDKVEKPIRDFLAGLGRLDRPWLTALEDGVLALLETN